MYIVPWLERKIQENNVKEINSLGTSVGKLLIYQAINNVNKLRHLEPGDEIHAFLGSQSVFIDWGPNNMWPHRGLRTPVLY